MAAEGGHIDFMFLAPPFPGHWIRYCRLQHLGKKTQYSVDYEVKGENMQL